MDNNSYYIMIKPESREQGKAFKQWCKSQKISMNKAFCLIMKKVIKGKFVIRQTIKEKQS